MVVADSWKGKFNKGINLTCKQCNETIIESTKHKFFKCPRAHLDGVGNIYCEPFGISIYYFTSHVCFQHPTMPP
jgi:hypothetical protein